MDWKLAEAKNKFSEVVRRALTEGPQRVVRRRDAVVVLAEEEYERLAGSRRSFKEFLLNAPAMDGIKIERDKSPMRDVTL